MNQIKIQNLSKDYLNVKALKKININITEGSLFQWKTKTEEISLDMLTGNSYFVNTGWLHRVTNDSNNIRIVLIFGVDYDNLPNKESLLI